jgi:putative phage-type endonuclease
MNAEHYNIISLIQGSNEWLDYRKTRIGASDAASIMGVGFQTPLEKWKEKLGLITIEKNSAMQRGQQLEPIARRTFIEQTGIYVEPMVVESIEHPWLFASLDGLSCDLKDEVAVEIKCPNAKDHELAMQGKIPEKYFPQLQHQMLVLNLDMMYYFSFDGSQGVTVLTYADSEYQRALVAKEQEFYKKLITFEQPELTDRDYIQKTDADFLYHVHEYRKLLAEEKKIEQLKESHRNAIVHLANQQNVEGGGVRVQQIQRRGIVDYTKIPEIQGLDLEKYRKPSIQSVRIMEIV